VESFFDIFKNEEHSKDVLDAGEAEFIKGDLVPYSVEHYLNITGHGDHHDCDSCEGDHE
jgi:hypothetical protein